MGLLNMKKYYGIASARLAVWLDATQVWDTSLEILNLNGFSITPKVDNSIARRYGVEADHLTVITGAELKLAWSHYDRTIVNAMMGLTSESSGAGSSQIRHTKVAGRLSVPYWGLIVQVLAANGGDAHFIFPQCKLRDSMPFDFKEANEFNKPDITVDAGQLYLENGTTYYVWDELEHATVTSIATDFNTAMADLVIS